ncbi:class I SAM-dependent methyltransferase [Mucilaginibacter sp. E4BP6]|uniref:class I SAM-dependent methyltransferase n=1 Tax=Mucilaginibacter sp. E4BP6 TaxID=2723089 RepID=UPI0015C9690B|nr:class I SAM-dependent methyltransferase [Mucilaginibacter sp. E4BP6]NYE65465.1 ubiquinone/menaquinone biosynthesis C-methylase UbiE [Mucilaginibacter sp. E4BP6]
MAANYNNSAWFYDSLARLVYGNALINAQVYLLKRISLNSKILIVGGGTGWILEEITRIHPSGLQITYVEIAPDMMAQSKKRNVGNNQVTFINDAIENVDLPKDFDIALTPFLLDNFIEENLNKIFSSIAALLKPKAFWLNTSFQLTGKWWQQVLLKTMFIFFKVTCGIEASKLPGIDKCFEENGFKLIEQQSFFGDFIGAKIFKK